MKHWLLATAFGLASSLAAAQPAQVVELSTRPAVKVRMLVEAPPAGRGRRRWS